MDLLLDFSLHLVRTYFETGLTRKKQSLYIYLCIFDTTMGDWDERNWDAVRRQEQKKQEVLVKASKNSEKIRQMVRQVEETKAIGAETLGELDKQSGTSDSGF